MGRKTERAKISVFFCFRSAGESLALKTLDWKSWKVGGKEQETECVEIWGSLARIKWETRDSCQNT